MAKEKIKDFGEFHLVVSLYFYGTLMLCVGALLFVIYYFNNDRSLDFPFLIYFFAGILFVWGSFFIMHAYKKIFDSNITMWVGSSDTDEFWMLIPYFLSFPIAWFLWKLKGR